MPNADPFLQRHPPVSVTGWRASTPAELFAVLAALAERLSREDASPDAQQLLARVWRVNNPLLIYLNGDDK